MDALADERLRARFETALKTFTRSLEIVLPAEKALPYVADAKAFGTIAHLARRRYRDHTLFDVRVYGEKVRALIDAHVRALGIEQKIPPISITAADYAEKVSGLNSPRAKRRRWNMPSATTSANIWTATPPTTSGCPNTWSRSSPS